MYAHTYRVLANCRCHITHVHGMKRAEEIVASIRNNTCFLKKYFMLNNPEVKEKKFVLENCTYLVLPEYAE